MGPVKSRPKARLVSALVGGRWAGGSSSSSLGGEDAAERGPGGSPTSSGQDILQVPSVPFLLSPPAVPAAAPGGSHLWDGVGGAGRQPTHVLPALDEEVPAGGEGRLRFGGWTEAFQGACCSPRPDSRITPWIDAKTVILGLSISRKALP